MEAILLFVLKYIFMHTVCREAALGSTHDCLLEFVGSSRNISGSIEPFHARLLTFVDDEISTLVFYWVHGVNNLRVRLIAHGDEYPRDLYRRFVLEH